MRVAAFGIVVLLIGIAGSTRAEGSQPMETDLASFDTLWNYQKPTETEEAFKALLPRAAESGDRSLHAQLLTQIARTQGLQGRFDEAHATLDQVEGMLGDDLETARIRYLLERGRAFNSSKKVDLARPLFLEAWDRAVAAKEEFYAVDAAHMMGIIEPPDEALAWNEKAMAHAEGAEDPKARNWLGALYNNIGWTYHDKGDYAKALEVFEKALVWRQEKGKEPMIRIARWSVARALRSLGRTEEALAKQIELERDWKEAGEEDGYVYEELGECLLALGRAEEARSHFARAYALLSQDQWLAGNEQDRLKRLKELGGVEAPAEGTD